MWLQMYLSHDDVTWMRETIYAVPKIAAINSRALLVV